MNEQRPGSVKIWLDPLSRDITVTVYAMTNFDPRSAIDGCTCRTLEEARSIARSVGASIIWDTTL